MPSANETPFPLAGKESFKVRALFVAERLDLKAMETTSRLASLPIVLSVRGSGCVVLFRFGVIVLFDVDPMDEVSYLESLKPFLFEPFPTPEKEEVLVKVDPDADEGVQSDIIKIKDNSVEIVQTIAEVMSRSAVLNHYEAKVAKTFDAIEPLAARLRNQGTANQTAKRLLEHLGDILQSQHTMVARVEVTEKPEVLWDHPKLERLFLRLMAEYEIEERHHAIERKLDLISRTTETVLDLLRTHQSHRLEWYIIGLIVFEILISLYDHVFGLRVVGG